MESVNVNDAARLAFKNKSLIENSEKVGCYYCLEIFNSNEIVEYTDQGKTALCPKCSCDCLLSESSYQLSPELLQRANKYWFGNKKAVSLKQ